MRTLRIVALVTLFVLMTQGIRHFYVWCLERRTSVLDRFDQTDTRKAIIEAKRLEELVARYEPARKRTDELEQERKKGVADKTTMEQRDLYEQKFRDQHAKEFQRECELRAAITEWEQHSKEIREIRVFWLFGLVLLAPGAVLIARRVHWMGMAFILPGLTEMLWWSSPSFRFAGSPMEFDRLLLNKLVLTIITFVLVLALWGLFERMCTKTCRASEDAAP